MRCAWCDTNDARAGEQFCSDLCESAYSNTVGLQCQNCGEWEDECICADDPRCTAGERMEQAADYGR